MVVLEAIDHLFSSFSDPDALPQDAETCPAGFVGFSIAPRLRTELFPVIVFAVLEVKGEVTGVF
jgi:hypothetical protein